MEAKLQEAINKLPVIQKAHIYEPKVDDVAELSFKAGRSQGITDSALSSVNAIHNATIDGINIGRQEVVKWIENRNHPYNFDHIRIEMRAWRERVKKWL